MAENKKYYILADSMYGLNTYPAKGKISLSENTSQKDLEYLYEEIGMTSCISRAEVNKKQIERLEARKGKKNKSQAIKVDGEEKMKKDK